MEQLFEAELKTWEKHRDELLGAHEGEYLLIRGDQLYGAYETEMDAVDVGYDRFGNVPFLVKQIVRVDIPITFGGGMLTIAR